MGKTRRSRKSRNINKSRRSRRSRRSRTINKSRKRVINNKKKFIHLGGMNQEEQSQTSAPPRLKLPEPSPGPAPAPKVLTTSGAQAGAVAIYVKGWGSGIEEEDIKHYSGDIYDHIKQRVADMVGDKNRVYIIWDGDQYKTDRFTRFIPNIVEACKEKEKEEETKVSLHAVKEYDEATDVKKVEKLKETMQTLKTKTDCDMTYKAFQQDEVLANQCKYGLWGNLVVRNTFTDPLFNHLFGLPENRSLKKCMLIIGGGDTLTKEMRCSASFDEKPWGLERKNIKILELTRKKTDDQGPPNEVKNPELLTMLAKKDEMNDQIKQYNELLEKFKNTPGDPEKNDQEIKHHEKEIKRLKQDLALLQNFKINPENLTSD